MSGAGAARNVGAVDRIIRGTGSVLLVVLGLFNGSWVVVGMGAFVGLTAALGFCPLYWMYRLSTVGGVHRVCSDEACGISFRRRRSG